MCLVPLSIAAGLGALLYILIKDEVMLKEMLIRFWNYAYIDCEWNFYNEHWVWGLFRFEDIRNWDL